MAREFRVDSGCKGKSLESSVSISNHGRGQAGSEVSFLRFKATFPTSNAAVSES